MPIPIGAYTSKGLAGFQSNGQRSEPTSVKTKGVSYSATQSDKILAISNDAASASSDATPNAIEIENTGSVPIMLIAGYRSYTDDTSDDATDYLHVLLPPSEVWSVPVRAVISSAADSTIMFGTAVDNLAPDGNMYTEFSDGVADIDSATAAGIVGNATNTTVYLEPYTSAANCSANLFRVGDLIRVRNEVMEVTAIGDKSNLANNYLTVKRDMYGTDGGTSAVDNDSTRLPFFNAYHDFDKYSVAQTDAQGRFKAFNFFGLGRTLTEVQGITPGSVAIKFYSKGFQELGLSAVTSSTNSGLAVSTAYQFTIAVDGGSAYDLDFTTDSSNVNWGGTNGVISKIQTVFDTQFYTSGNLFEKKVSIGIVGGDIRFTSGSHLSTSAIALADSSGGDTDLWAAGRVPAVANIDAAVGAKLPDDVTYDRVTYATSPNTSAFCYDDGKGNLFGAASGSINYETGACSFVGPVNAEFVISCSHTSAFSGKLNEATADRINSLVDIYANTPSQKWNGSVKVRTY